MTRDEMKLRFEQLGGVTGKNACLVTIEKYRSAGREAIWRAITTTRTSQDHYPQGSNCGCCHMWSSVVQRVGPVCHEDCPLNTPALQCDTEASPYEQVRDGRYHRAKFDTGCDRVVGDDSPYKQVVHHDHNRVVFDEGCDRIVAACQHWLADHEEDTP